MYGPLFSSCALCVSVVYIQTLVKVSLHLRKGKRIEEKTGLVYKLHRFQEKILFVTTDTFLFQ